MKELVAPTFLSSAQPIGEVLELLTQADVTLAEANADAPATHIDMTDQAAVAALSEVLTGLPIKVHSIHAPFSTRSEAAWDISQPDEAQRELAIQGHQQILRAGAALGARHVVIHPGVNSCSLERLANCHMSLARLAEAAQHARVRIAVENLLPGYPGNTLADMQQLLSGLDADVVGFCLDTGHAKLGPDSSADFIRALGDRLIAIHWQDNNGTEDDHLFPGAGPAVWDEFFAALTEVGYDLPVTVEAFPPEGISLKEAVRAAREALAENRAPVLPCVSSEN